MPDLGKGFEYLLSFVLIVFLDFLADFVPLICGDCFQDKGQQFFLGGKSELNKPLRLVGD